MESTAQQRLFEIYRAYYSALTRRPGDLRDCTTEAQVDRVLANIDKLHAAYFRAARSALDSTGGEIEAAYVAAQTANAQVDSAYAAEAALAERIRQVAKVVAKVGELVAKASGK